MYLQPNWTQNTYNSILTVHKVSTSMVSSGRPQVGELLLVAILIVNINFPGDGITTTSNHQYVLQLDGTNISKNRSDSSQLVKFLGGVFDPPQVDVMSSEDNLSTYNVFFAKLKPGEVVLVVEESSSDVCSLSMFPPIKRIPAGDCQAT